MKTSSILAVLFVAFSSQAALAQMCTQKQYDQGCRSIPKANWITAILEELSPPSQYNCLRVNPSKEQGSPVFLTCHVNEEGAAIDQRGNDSKEVVTSEAN